MDNAIEARGLEKTYRGDVKALKGVSLAAAEGTVFGLLGPNGAGKSTTVKILTTLSRPDAGEAYVAGYDVVKQPGKVRLAIGAVAQKSGLDPQMTGRENLVLQGRVYGMRGAALNSRAQELLERFGLDDAARPHRAHVLRRHAAQARRGRRPHAPAAGAVPRRADDRAGPGGAHGHVDRDRPPRRRRGPHHPHDDALHGRGRRPRPAAGDRRPGSSSPRARPTSSRASCAATRSPSSSRTSRSTARSAAPSTGCRTSTTSPWSRARCGRAPTAAPAPSRRCSRPSRPRASRSPR